MSKKSNGNAFSKALAFVTLSAFAFVSVPALPLALAAEIDAPAETVTVTIVKYIGDERATTETANDASFQMVSTWNAENIGEGSGEYTLDGSSYEESTTEMTSGADYSTSEVLNETVGESCDGDEPFALVGYSHGNTLEEAEAASISDSAELVDITEDKYVIVWNEDCNAPEPAESVQVHISKFIDGEQATAESASSSDFTMLAVWDSTSHGSSAGQEYVINESSEEPYQVHTVEFNPGADYSTSEVMNETVGATCEGDEPFALQGYTVGDTFEEAAEGTPSDTVPAFIDLESDKYVIVWNEDCNAPDPTPETVKVVINKFIDGEQATAENASSTVFTMSAVWATESHGNGAGEYELNENGIEPNPTPYQAQTHDLNPGADYSTSEVMNENVGATCDGDEPFALQGYTVGNTFEEAASGTPSIVAPAFVDLMQDKHVIVWNTDCNDEPVPQDPQDTVVVQINKFIDGQQATAQNASSTSFLMDAAWASTNLGAGAGQYALDANGYESDATTTPYQARTSHMDNGASYSTSEVVDGNVVGANCDADAQYALKGYTVGSTYQEAASGTPSMVAPSFTNLQNDKFVIVWNEDCDENGTIGGEVGDAQLAVTSIETLDGSATANGTFADGWRYLFHITAPSSEESLAMKFSEWVNSSNASTTFPAANNMRISSEQDTSTTTVMVTANDTYTTPPLVMTTDLDPSTPGRQVQVLVEVAVPSGTPSGSYTTNYGVRTE